MSRQISVNPRMCIAEFVYIYMYVCIYRSLLRTYSLPACLDLFGKNQSIYLRCNEGVTPVTG